MNSHENKPSVDPLDALTSWDQQHSKATRTAPINAADVVQTSKIRQRNRAIAASSITLALICILGVVVTNSLSRPNKSQVESASNEHVQKQHNERPIESNVTNDSQIAMVPEQPNSNRDSKSFNQHLAMVDSSLSGFHQLSNSVVHLNTIDRRSQQNQYLIERNRAMLDVLSSVLLETN